jgi:hypothetical protein
MPRPLERHGAGCVEGDRWPEGHGAIAAAPNARVGQPKGATDTRHLKSTGKPWRTPHWATQRSAERPSDALPVLSERSRTS